MFVEKMSSSDGKHLNVYFGFKMLASHLVHIAFM